MVGGVLGVIQGDIGVVGMMEKKMESIIMGLSSLGGL